jgi:HlyD family secretion protein
MKKIFIFLSITLGLSACGNNKDKIDASGTFETTETIIPAEANGVIKMFNIVEGQTLQAGQKIGSIDTVQLYLKKKQLQAQVKATLSQKPDIAKQLASLETQLKAAEKEKNRIGNLLKSDAATPKQMDDANTAVESARKQIDALYSSLSIQSNNISQQVNPLLVQIEQTNDQLAKCKIINTVNGTVVTKYAEANEMASAGKPLYKIADLSSMILRAYVTGDQFAALKLNQPVTVLVDSADRQYKEYPGTIEWISNKAEFTPKTIQTKDERANLVYAIKIRVKNDGLLKIGMYADVKL